MNGIGVKVQNKSYGAGSIIDISERYVTVRFHDSDKKFQYPEAFQTHLVCDDAKFTAHVLSLLAEKEKSENEARRKKEEQEREREREIIKRASDQNSNSKHNQKKKYPRENIAFKCNFCDGGASENRIGFRGVCSDALIEYNIYDAKHTWCSCDESDCLRYFRREMSRKQLDEFMDTEFGVCYESQMLNNWTAFAGIVQTGERKGTAMKLNQVQAHSLCVLTTREPNMPEKDRYIFAAFLIDETFEGDNREAGYVTTNSDLKIELSPQEARTMKFWKYHSNKNKPENAV